MPLWKRRCGHSQIEEAGRSSGTRYAEQMRQIPEGARWWLADLIVEMQIGGEPGRVVHYNLTLIRAGDAEEAYSKALARGAEEEIAFTNTDGDAVRVLFRGLRNLFPVYEDLEDGAEILYEEGVDVKEEEILAAIRRKEDLAAFAPPPSR